jgi:hypothetical protein
MPTRTEGTSVAALVCAIGSWILLPVLLAVVALVLAGRADRAIATNPTASGMGLVTAARWLAGINLVLAAMVVAFVAAFTLALWWGR